jgi:hypothetical protein
MPKENQKNLFGSLFESDFDRFLPLEEEAGNLRKK